MTEINYYSAARSRSLRPKRNSCFGSSSLFFLQWVGPHVAVFYLLEHSRVGFVEDSSFLLVHPEPGPQRALANCGLATSHLPCASDTLPSHFSNSLHVMPPKEALCHTDAACTQGGQELCGSSHGSLGRITQLKAFVASAQGNAGCPPRPFNGLLGSPEQVLTHCSVSCSH